MRSEVAYIWVLCIYVVGVMVLGEVRDVDGAALAGFGAAFGVMYWLWRDKE